jgi:hypothetical protein
MSQTGFTPIQIYSSSTAAAAPVAGSLTNSTLGSELAINITDGKLFYKDNANVIQVIGWKVVPAVAGGTGQTSYAVGDILFANTTTSLAKLADVATGNALISGGVGAAPAYGKIGLTTHISGVLPVANGGTNASTASITSFNNITGYTALGATGTTSTNLVFSTSPSITTPTLVGDVTVSTGNVVIGTSGKGIDFSGVGTAAEILDDYEEGTWTVEWFDAATAGNQSASTTTGYYTKVGRIVTINFVQANISTVGMTAGNTLFYTLPFAAVSMGEIIGNGMLRAVTWPLSSAVQTVQINSYLAGGTPSRASFQASTSTVNSVAVTVGAMTSGTSDLYVQLTFAA